MEQATISPMAAAYLAADRIGKSGGMMTVHAPLTGAKIDILDLGVKILSAAFAELVAMGAMSLELTEKKVLFVKTHHLTVHRTDVAVPAGPLAQLASCATEGRSVSDTVYAWLGGDSYSPWSNVVIFAENEAQQAGFVQPEAGGATVKKVFGALVTGGVRQMSVVPERKSDADSLVAAFVERWNAFQAKDPALAAELLKEVGSGINRRKETPDTNSF